MDISNHIYMFTQESGLLYVIIQTVEKHILAPEDLKSTFVHM